MALTLAGQRNVELGNPGNELSYSKYGYDSNITGMSTNDETYDPVLNDEGSTVSFLEPKMERSSLAPQATAS